MASERIQRRIDILLDEADKAIAGSDWSAVRDRAKNVLALDPSGRVFYHPVDVRFTLNQVTDLVIQNRQIGVRSRMPP